MQCKSSATTPATSPIKAGLQSDVMARSETMGARASGVSEEQAQALRVKEKRNERKVWVGSFLVAFLDCCCVLPFLASLRLTL